MKSSMKNGTESSKKAAEKSENSKQATNGKSKRNEPLESTKTGGISFPLLLGCLIAAAVSFGAGVVTPLMLFSGQTSRSSSSSSSSRSLSAASSTPTECNQETLSQFLHDEPAVGMHLLCINAEDNTFTAYQFLHEKLDEPLPLKTNWDEFKNLLQSHLALQTLELRQPWAIFTHDGVKKIVSADDDVVDGNAVIHELKQQGVVVIMEGGNWLWPGVRVGFRRTIDLSEVPGTNGLTIESRNATLETLSLHPLVLSVEGFLTDEECDFIQEKAMPDLKYSQVTLMDKDKGRPSSDFRTSQSTFVRNTEETMKQVDYRTASLVRIPRSHQEHVQVLRYGNNEHYSAHHDYFDPSLYQNDPGTLRTIEHGRRNRLATVFWYLTDVARGGETNFPLHNYLPYPSTLDKCTQGLMVKPQRGKVIIFYSLQANGDMDPLSLHAACHVEEGVKFAANKWVWNAPMGHLAAV